MKSHKHLKEKIKETKDKIKSSTQEEGQLFTYWLGYLRALEWIQKKEK